MKIAFFTDPHLSFTQKPKALELLGKPFTGYLNWQKRHHKHDSAVLEALVSEIKSHQPDLVICGGDVVNLGLESEVANASTFLSQFENLLFVPGNHDAYTRAGEKRMMALPFWQEYPHVLEYKNCVVIGLCSAVPMPPFNATGSLGFTQIEKLRVVLRLNKHKHRIIVLHHPPLEMEGGSGHKRLSDMHAFQKVINDEGAELILHGHTHRNSLHHLHLTPVYGFSSSSGTIHANDKATWGLIEVGEAIKVTAKQPLLPPL